MLKNAGVQTLKVQGSNVKLQPRIFAETWPLDQSIAQKKTYHLKRADPKSRSNLQLKRNKKNISIKVFYQFGEIQAERV